MSSEWRTRKKGTRRQKGSKFPIEPSELGGSHSTPPPATFHTIQTKPKKDFYTQVEEKERALDAIYEKKRQEKEARIERAKDIMAFRMLLEDKDAPPEGKALARAKFKRKYPDIYEEYMLERTRKHAMKKEKKSLFGKVFSTKIIERKEKKEES